uniref:PHD finger protein ALFIN-LIKE n=1 Tax=Aegilops tauschii subsp. strangulata TaxID=200361 RepID=A0A453HGQ7_AEGTS
MDEKDWLSLVAVHSDAWLLAVAFYFGILRRLEEKKRLFSMINNLPTIYEVVTGTAKKQVKEKHPKSSSKINKSGTKGSKDATTSEG